MQDHPIPQAVTSYEFHLIGNMTLKQFLEVAAGVVLAFFVYQTNLYSAIKWPIMIFLAGLGALIAFVPYEGRPLDQWFVALIRAIYKPTQFYWKKSGNIPEYFSFTKSAKNLAPERIDLSPYRKQRTQEYISSLPADAQADPLEVAEYQRIGQINSLFSTVQVTANPQPISQPPEPEFDKPDLTTRPHSLRTPEDLMIDSIPDSPTPVAPVSAPAPIPGIDSNTKTVADISIPENIATAVESQTEQQPLATQADTTSDQGINIFTNVQQAGQALSDNSVAATTSSTLPFPKRPTKPNILVGMVFTKLGGIVDNAIVEITDKDGLPVRAVKTNSIGQFAISTPLKDGEYYLKVDKEGVQFPTQKLVLNNQIIDPIEIRET